MSRTRLLASLLLVCLALTPAAARVLERVSVATDGSAGNGNSAWPALNADGRYVAFGSWADNLVAGDSNGLCDIFVHDRTTGVTERVSVSSSEEQGTGQCLDDQRIAISGDGRYVVFVSTDSNLVAGDDNGCWDIFVRDRTAGITERVSVSSLGAQSNGNSYTPEISLDGRYVVFASDADNLVSGDGNQTTDIFIHDRTLDTTQRVSVATNGTQANGPSYRPAVSADGRFVVFESDADLLVTGDSNAQRDIFIRDRLSNTTSRVMGTGGVQPEGGSEQAAISADGRYIAFRSWANNLVPSDPNGWEDIFLYDRLTQAIELVSVGSDYGSAMPRLSSDGRFVAFRSWSNAIVPLDTNGWDTFVRNRQTGVTARLNVSALDEQANGESDGMAISADGRFVAFHTGADNLIPDDTNQACDVFVATTSPATPVAPADLEAAPQCDVKVQVSWTNQWDCQTHLHLERRVGAGDWEQIAEVAADATSYLDTRLTPATTYQYRLCAGNDFAHSAYTGPVTATTAPAWNVQSVCWRVNYGNNWNRSGWVQVPGATAIRLHFSSIQVEHLAKYDEMWSDAGDYWSGTYDDFTSVEKPAATVTLYLQSDSSVTGYFAIDRVEWEGTATGPAAFGGDLFSGALVLAAPSGLAGTVPSPRCVRLTWTDHATTESGFRIQRKAGDGGTWAQIATVGPNVTTYDDPAAPAGRTWYRVGAYNADGTAYCEPVLALVNTFADVPASAGIWRYVEAVVREGITSGCSTSPPRYCPDSPVTRGQMAVFLCRAAGIAPYDNPTPTFADVPSTHSQYQYIEALYRAGVTAGCSTVPMRYCPTSPVTRGQMAVFVCRAAGIAPYANPTPTFTDVPLGSSQYQYVEALCRAGVTSGCATSPPQYCPTASILRGQMAVFLCRAFEIPLD